MPGVDPCDGALGRVQDRKSLPVDLSRLHRFTAHQQSEKPMRMAVIYLTRRDDFRDGSRVLIAKAMFR
ncbi:hypothetical protein GCM10016455_29040 [Aliiroseovarius zhejiangensis]|uniref:Uncharacterized protein n=1 Tax=Aliiroseovarius zhejiangensis TaxID=1632025 RepID=A0ABQ3J976_9RHOB|nr:hypothetical protein GCM10016455_29040 [Aliiroseovarius zhejiangensis]